MKHIDIDIDYPEKVDTSLIDGIDSKTIIDKIREITPSVLFEHDGRLTHKVVSMSRFMMAGMGFKPRYWLCSGASSLEKIMKYNFEEEDFRNLIRFTGREDVFMLFGMPLFYGSDARIEDALFMVSDLSEEEVKIHHFLLSDKYGNDANEEIVATERSDSRLEEYAKRPAPPAPRTALEAPPAPVDGDWDDDDIPF